VDAEPCEEARSVRYLILAAGMGKRLGKSSNGQPKCLLRVACETIIGRLVRQIGACDPDPRITVVAGYKSDEVTAAVPGCSVIINPFYDITGINASIWFARSCFEDDLLMVNGDLIFPDDAIKAFIARFPSSFICYDSRILDPKEINVLASQDVVLRFGVNFKDYSGAYAGVIGFSRDDGILFARLLDERIKRGFNEPRTYYFAFIRSMINRHGVRFFPFNLSAFSWAEIDYANDMARAQALFE
jgi:choline kinase